MRLRALDRMARASEEGKDFGRAAELLEQAAKEVGGVYVCRGGPRSIQGQQRSPRSRSTPALTTSPSWLWCKRRSKNPSVKQPSWSVAPE